jgi:hypothetical protein
VVKKVKNDEAIPPFPICLHGMVLKARDNFTFTLYVLMVSISLQFRQREEERKEIAEQFKI